MRCQDVMKANVVTCQVTDSVRWCAQLMKDWNVGFLPVLAADGRLAGVLTDRDLVVRAMAENKPLSTPAGEVMSQDLVVCAAGADLRVAEEKMAEERKSRIAVVDEHGVCVGVISLSDVAQADSRRRAGQVFREVTQREAGPREEGVPTGFE